MRNPFNTAIWAVLTAVSMVACTACQQQTEHPVTKGSTRQANATRASWEGEFQSVLPLLGHRNWVLVTDKAFPLQNAPGITYINTNSQLLPVLEHVLASMHASTHVKPQLYTDRELQYLTPEMVPGITEFRDSLLAVLKGVPRQTIPHDSVFTTMQRAAGLFKIIVLKTEATIP
jgi:hypothetical protein